MGSVDWPHPTLRLPGLHSRFKQLSPEDCWLRVALNLCKLNTVKTGSPFVTLAWPDHFVFWTWGFFSVKCG